MAKLKRGPKPMAAKEKKVQLRLWVKAKYKKLAEMHLAKLEVKFDDEPDADKELKEFNAHA